MDFKVFTDVKNKEQKKSSKWLITLEVKAQLVVNSFQKHDKNAFLVVFHGISSTKLLPPALLF